MKEYKPRNLITIADEIINIIKTHSDLKVERADEVIRKIEKVKKDYSYTFMKSIKVEKGVIYESDINDIIYTSKDDYVEELCDYFSDDVRYSNLTDAEYEKEMQKEADKVPHYEAIKH